MKTRIIDSFLTHWFWIISALFLIVFFNLAGNSLIQSFYFVSFFLPAFIGTSWYVNTILIPDYLVRQQYGRFVLYSLYTLIISIYIHFLIIYIAIYIFTIFQMGTEHIITISISTLSMVMYLLIIIKAFSYVFQIMSQKDETIRALESAIKKNDKPTIQIRFNRKNYSIALDDIEYIESQSDYIKIYTTSESYMTKARLGKFTEALPDHFIRIHRSFVVNRQFVHSFNREYLSLNSTQLPISRSYKQAVFEQLQSL